MFSCTGDGYQWLHMFSCTGDGYTYFPILYLYYFTPFLYIDYYLMFTYLWLLIDAIRFNQVIPAIQITMIIFVNLFT